MSLTGIGSTRNYMVPSSGSTHQATYSGVFSATPLNINWDQFAIDNFPFIPQGAFIDNTKGTGPLTINIQPLNYNVVVPAGVGAQVQFPAPAHASMSITGQGQASVVFVDFPVLPNAGLVDIGNTVNINIESIAAGLVIPVSPTANAQGVPYQVQQQPAVAEYGHIALTSAAATGNYTPATPNLNLRRLVLSLTADAYMAAAGENLLSVTVNGVTVFQEKIWMPAAAGSGPQPIYHRNLPFDGVSFNFAAGNITVTLGTALAGGTLDANVYVG